MKKAPVQWLTVLVVFALLLIPVLSVAAQGGGTTLYLPFVSKQTPVPNPAVKQVGPAGGTFPAVAVEPGNASTLYVGTWGLGVQKSLDGGLTWQAVNAGLGNRYIQSLVVRSDGWVYAGTYGSGVYRSQDGGASWAAINTGSNPTDNGRLVSFIIYDIEIDPSNSQTMYISGRIPGSCSDPLCPLSGYVYKSINGGESWALSWDSSDYTTYVNNAYLDIGDYSYDVEVDPMNSQIVYLAGHRGSGVYKSINGGVSWYMTQDITLDRSARKILIVNGTPQAVYNSTYDTAGVYKTTDGGSTWVQKASGLPSPLYGFALSRDSQNPNDIYLGTGDRGVYKSTTLAESWTDWGLGSNFIWAFAQVPGSSPALYAATSGNGLQYSSDGAQYNWQSRHEGVFNTNITGLASYNSALYAGVNGGGVFKTTDRGDTWQALNSGLTNLNVQNLQVISGSLYAFTTSSLFVLSGDGTNWSVANSSYLTQPLQSPVSPAVGGGEAEPAFTERSVFPPEEQYLMQPNTSNGSTDLDSPQTTTLRQVTSAAANWKGLWIGTAGGGVSLINGWCQAFNGRTIYALHSSLANNILYASLPGSTSPYAVVYWNLKNNDCTNWDTVVFPGSVKVFSFASSSSFTYAASSNGVYYLPSNSGTWQTATGISGNVYSIIIDPNHSNLLYAAADSGAYLSTDGGLTWSQAPRADLKGVPFLSVSVDPTDSNIIYFGSREGSTYRWDTTLP